MKHQENLWICLFKYNSIWQYYENAKFETAYPWPSLVYQGSVGMALWFH